MKCQVCKTDSNFVTYENGIPVCLICYVEHQSKTSIVDVIENKDNMYDDSI